MEQSVNRLQRSIVEWFVDDDPCYLMEFSYSIGGSLVGWTNAWAEFVPFLQFDMEIHKVICATNAIESINARLRRAVNARGHFPTEQAGRWTSRWKPHLNPFDLAFDGRLSARRN